MTNIETMTNIEMTMDGMTGIELIQAIVRIHDYLIRGLIDINDFTQCKNDIRMEWIFSNITILLY